VRAGWQLQVLAGAGQGPSRPVALGLAPGLLRHSWLRGGRLAWGGGWWRRSPGGHLEAACLLEESRSDAGDSGRSLLLHVGLGWDIR